MINQVYRLVSPRQFEISYKDHSINAEHVVIRPTHLSICAADQRYYTGSRGKEALAKKLPMALIHEGVGEVVYDPQNEFKTGTRVVMIPNTPTETDEIIAENYLRSSKFRSSGFDGFMQDYVFMDRDRIVTLPRSINPHVAAFIELITISMHALVRFDAKAHPRRETFGVWGDGNLGFITALILKKYYKDSKVIVFGKTPWKLDNFSFADEVYQIHDIPENVQIDHAFECVGGKGSQYAIDQIIDLCHPEGTVSILGVSEYPVEINTRMVLEKGLTIIGSSRSGRKDFENTVNFLSQYTEVVDYLTTLVGSVNEVKSIQDVINAFEYDLSTSWGKTVMEWKI
ncbi:MULTISPECIES: ribitol-5-phosphate dehydrogenase [unclassified Bacillus (in: firmicutes)]|uniref:ribitol-5-phosphate dehydrogenase n=1 Tax=unclassified Bacillus (in: firmicutes) TaxID=185979 RepID=UPI0008E08C82|nr:MULTISPECIES: ribitol-5-phosphate dehydrogenase [unclassified Bacillus (in: firmicutes)]SFB21086.1 ribitol-5-phosphate 2-dehydrogenase [Bacillus sp. UNCCL13]SFQ90962.1 ribitol-5-phosphate 2-dehydrogenase [Bacillus sp. cl95]